MYINYAKHQFSSSARAQSEIVVTAVDAINCIWQKVPVSMDAPVAWRTLESLSDRRFLEATGYDDVPAWISQVRSALQAIL